MHLPARILLPLWLLCLAFSSRAQSISLTVENQALEKVMASIEQQSGHHFIYSSEMMSLSKPVTASFRNETLARALEICFKDQPLTYTLNDKHIVLQVKKPKAAAEEKRVFTGQVVDEKGEGLPGISVLIKGTSKGTTTDAKGQFLLDDVPASFRLEISGVSIETREIAITNTSFLKIETTQKLGELDQTVVIAYGSAKKRYLVESVSKVKGDDISKQSVSNPILALGGRVAGLQIIQGSGVPGSVVIFRLRGVNSLANGSLPLFIVDGVPVPAVSNNISFQGAGALASPLDNLNPSNIESIEVLKDAAATSIYGSRGANGVILITTKKSISSKPEFNVSAYSGIGRIASRYNLLNTQEFLEMRKEAFANDSVVPTVSNAPDLKLWDSTRYTDWQKYLIGNQMKVTDFNASLSVGNSQTHYLVGTGYRRENTVYAGDYYSEKISGFSNFNHISIDKRFDLSASVSFLQNRSVLPREDLTTYIKTAPNAPSIYTSGGGLNWENSTWINPGAALMQQFTGQAETWQANMNLGYKFFRGFEVRFTSGINSVLQSDNYRIPSQSINPASTQLPTASFSQKLINTLIIEPQASYSTTFHRSHSIVAQIGGSLQNTIQKGLVQTGTGYASDELMRSISNAATITTGNEVNIRYRYAGLFTRIQYDYNRKYLASFSLRRDGSSRYGPANRFSTFSSLGLGWMFSSEKWMKTLRWLDYGKLRGSFGVTGNDQIGDYKYLDLYSPGSYSYQGVPVYTPAQLFSPNYSWERVEKLEAAIEFSAFKSRFSGSVGYYLNKTDNQLVSYPLPLTTGFSGVLRNIPALIENKGWEIEASLNIIESTRFKWSTNFNVSIPRNKLVKFDRFESSSYAENYILGQSLNSSWQLHLTGVDPTTGLYAYQDVDKDGRVSIPGDMKTIVSTAVNYYGGIENSFSFGMFDFSFHFYFVKQPHARSYQLYFNKPGSIDNQPSWVMARWKKSGEMSNIQRFTSTASAPATSYGYLALSDGQFSNGSFMRIRNIRLAYRFQNNSVYLTGQNILLLTKFKGLDPETGNALPPIKTFTLGVNFKIS